MRRGVRFQDHAAPDRVRGVVIGPAPLGHNGCVQ